MAYKTEIQIGVKGVEALTKLQKSLEGTNFKINEINKKQSTAFGGLAQSIKNYSQQLQLAEKALNKVAAATPQETKAVNNYVTALGNANAAIARQNSLIQQEITNRTGATAALKAYNAEAAASRTPGGSVAGRYMRPGSAVSTTQYSQPLEPAVASSMLGGAAKSAKGGGAKGALEKAGAFGLGTGFPLLFGGGVGQVAGGGIGTALAGAFGLAGQAAMGLQIGLSAILGKAEELIVRFREVGNAVNSLNVDALAGSFITVTENVRTLVSQLVEAGDAQAAVSVAAAETFKQTGVMPEAVADVTNITNLLSNAWDEVVGSVGGLVSLIAAPLLAALAGVLKIVGMAFKGLNLIVQGVGHLLKDLFGLEPILGFLRKNVIGIVEEEEKGLAALRQTSEQLEREYTRSKELFDLEMKRTAGRTAAEKLINAETKRDIELKKLSFETADKIKKLREEHGKVTTHQGQVELQYAELQIQKQAKLQEQRIQHTLELDKQNIALARQKEIEKEKIKQHKRLQGAVEAQTVALDGQVQIFELQAQSAQKVFDVTQARAQAEQSLLKLEESRLTQKLKRLQEVNGFYGTQKALINEISKNRIKQARLEFKTAQQTIDQMVAQAELERQMVRFKVEGINLQIEMLRLKALETEDTKLKLEKLAAINQQRKIMADVAKATSIAADKSLAATREIAKSQGLSAKHILTGKLESIALEQVEGRRAVNAAAIARSHQQAAGAMAAQSKAQSTFQERFGIKMPKLGEKTTRTHSITTNSNVKTRTGGNERLPKTTTRIPKSPVQFAKGGHVSGPQMALIGEAGPEYVVPERKAAAFATNYLMGARGAAAIPRYAEGGYTGPINIQTGPVMQQGGETYLTMAQFEAGMRELSESVARGGRSYGSRQFQGVS